MKEIIIALLSALFLHGCSVQSSQAGGFASASEINSPSAGIRCFAISDANNNVVSGNCIASP